MSEILMVFCAGSVGGVISTILTLAWVTGTINKVVDELKNTTKEQSNGQTSQS